MEFPGWTNLATQFIAHLHQMGFPDISNVKF